jgi:beta-glucuronidase
MNLVGLTLTVAQYLLSADAGRRRNSRGRAPVTARNSSGKSLRALHAALFVSIVLIVSTFGFNCYAATIPVDDSGFREVSLSGRWKLRFDPNDLGEKSGWPAKTWLRSKSTAVPGSFNQEFQDHLWYQGKVWYRTTFRVDRSADPEARTYLRFLGVTLRCKVWVNGHLLGENKLPYVGFTFDATDALRYGAKNTVVVMVDNKILANAIPDKKWRGWWDFGGITRPVYLEQRLRLSSNIVVTTDTTNDTSWTLRLKTTTTNYGPDTPGTIRYALTDGSGNTIWSSNRPEIIRNGRSHQIVEAPLKNIKPWSPESPSLYQLAIRTEDNRGHQHLRTVRVGFRKIEVRGSSIYLNGAPLQLRGMSRHEMFAASGSTVPSDRTREDFEEIKAAGSNMVRLAHYPQSPEVYDLCDELGLLVWSEIPAWQSSAETLADPAVFSTYAAPELKAMVQEFRNHPSVIVWSVANEVPSQLPEVAEYIHKAVKYVHGLDPTRLVTFASDKRERDLSFGFVDIIAVNEYFGWYYGKPTDVGPMLDNLETKFPNKPILVTEFGAEGVPGWQKPAPDAPGKDYSLQHQVIFLQTHLSQIFAPQRRRFVAGGLVWVYNDFPDPHRVGGDHPKIASYRNNKGLVTEDRHHKPAFETVKDFFTNLSTEQAGPSQAGGSNATAESEK